LGRDAVVNTFGGRVLETFKETGEETTSTQKIVRREPDNSVLIHRREKLLSSTIQPVCK
jgi:hypothetical protein